MYRIHVSVMQAQSQCHNFMPSLKGYSTNSGNTFTLSLKKCAEHMPMVVYGTSHGSNDFNSQQTKRWMDALVFHIIFNSILVMR